MKLKDLMTPDVQTIDGEVTLQEAAEQMRNWEVGALPVCDESAMVGMITDRDIVVRAIAKGLDPVKTQVRDCMTHEITSCPAGYEIEQAADLMRQKKIRRIVVEDSNLKPIGIVSLADLALNGRDEALTGQVLQEVSKP